MNVCAVYLGKRWNQDAGCMEKCDALSNDLLRKTLCLGTHVDVNLTRATCLNIVADQLKPLLAVIFFNSNGLFQHDNAPCHTAHTVQGRSEEHDEESKVFS